MDSTQFGIMPPGGLSPPKGLNAAMEGLVREVLRKNPKDIFAFAAEYFETLIEIRKKSNSGGDLEVSNYINMYQNFQENIVEEKDFLEAKTMNDNIPKNSTPLLESESPLNVENIEDENEKENNDDSEEKHIEDAEEKHIEDTEEKHIEDTEEKHIEDTEEKHIEDTEKQNTLLLKNTNQADEIIKSIEDTEDSENNVLSIQKTDEDIDNKNTSENANIDNNDDINKKENDEQDTTEVNTNEDHFISTEDTNSKIDNIENSKEESNLAEIEKEIGVEVANEEELEKSQEVEVMNENEQVSEVLQDEKVLESVSSEDIVKDDQPNLMDNSDNVLIDNNVQSSENEANLEKIEKVSTQIDETSLSEQVEIISKSSTENIDIDENITNEKQIEPEVIDVMIATRIENEENVSEEINEKNCAEVTENVDSEVANEKNSSEVTSDNIEPKDELKKLDSEVITEKIDSEVINVNIEPEEASEKLDSEVSNKQNDSEVLKENTEPKESIEKNDSEVTNENIELKEEIEKINTEEITEKTDPEEIIEKIDPEILKEDAESKETMEKTDSEVINENIELKEEIEKIDPEGAIEKIDSEVLKENTETEETVKDIDSEVMTTENIDSEVANEKIDSELTNENIEPEEAVEKNDSEEPIEKAEIIETMDDNVVISNDKKQSLDQNVIELKKEEEIVSENTESIENAIMESNELITSENLNNVHEKSEAIEDVSLLKETRSVEKEADAIDNLANEELKIPEEISEQVKEETNDLEMDKSEKETPDPSDETIEKEKETKTESFDTVENDDVINDNLEPRVFINSEKSQKHATDESESTHNLSTLENEDKNGEFEKAAILIQKIIRGFIVRSKMSSQLQEKRKALQRQGNEKSSDNENSLDMSDNIISTHANTETLLSTVPEEKNNSYSTEEESSTFSSAATKIQANVRGYLTRKYLQRNRTNNSSDTTAPSIGEDSKSLDDIGNVLETNISTEDTVNKIIVASSSLLVEQLEHFEQLGNKTFDNNLGSFDISKDGDESSTRARKRLRREDAIQLHSPYSSEETSINKQSPVKISDDEEPIGDLAQSIITEIVSNSYQPDTKSVEEIEKEIVDDVDETLLESSEATVENIVAEIHEVQSEHTAEEEKIDSTTAEIDSSTEKEVISDSDMETVEKDQKMENDVDEKVVKMIKTESVQSDDNDVIVGSMKISRPKSSEISEVAENLESKVDSDKYPNNKANIFQSMEKSSLEKALECDVIQSILEQKEMADAQKTLVTDEMDVHEKPSKLMHSGEFHDTVLPTKVIRKSTSAAKD